jgi:hypothetical protein
MEKAMMTKFVKTAALAAAIAWSGAALAQGVDDPGIGSNGEGPNAANGPGPNGSNDGMVRGHIWRHAGIPGVRGGPEGRYYQRR